MWAQLELPGFRAHSINQRLHGHGCIIFSDVAEVEWLIASVGILPPLQESIRLLLSDFETRPTGAADCSSPVSPQFG